MGFNREQVVCIQGVPAFIVLTSSAVRTMEHSCGCDGLICSTECGCLQFCATSANTGNVYQFSHCTIGNKIVDNVTDTSWRFHIYICDSHSHWVCAESYRPPCVLLNFWFLYNRQSTDTFSWILSILIVAKAMTHITEEENYLPW